MGHLLAISRSLHDSFKNMEDGDFKTLKKKYGLVSEFIPYQDQLEKFNLLHILGIIDLNELEEEII